MATPTNTPDGRFPSPIAEAVRQAVETTFATIFQATPLFKGEAELNGPCSGVLGTIAFVGEPPWTFSLMLPQTTAPTLVEKFAGFAIPYDSPDMGDVVGELANVIAGDIVARCEAKRIKAQMSLPTVARGTDLEMLSPPGMPCLRLNYEVTEGGFWIKLATAKQGKTLGRRPGT